MKKSCLLVVFTMIIAAAVAQSNDSLILKPIKAKTTMVNGSVMMSNMNIVQNITRVKEYSVLSNLILSAGYKETLESKGPITFFAPDNKAFKKLPAGKLDTLLQPEHKFELSTIVAYHAVAGKLTARDIAKNIREHKGVAQYVTLAGTKLLATINADRNIVLTDETGGQCTISLFDIEQSNGILHVVNGVFISKAKVI